MVQTMDSYCEALLICPFSPVFGQNVRPKILFSNTFNLGSSLNVRDHKSEAYSTNGNIICLYQTLREKPRRQKVIEETVK
jgi:hypothetical protein